MPFFEEETTFLDNIQSLPKDKDDSLEAKIVRASPTFFGELIPAALRRENSIGSFINSSGYIERADRPDGVDQTFNPFADIEGYEEYADSFAFANSDEEVSIVKSKIDQEKSDKLTLEEGGWLGTIAQVAAGVLDPINYIPTGEALTALRAGQSVLTHAAATARSAVLGMSVSELALHTTQETRTLGESASSIAGAAFLGGILGGAAGAWKNRLTSKGLTEDIASKQVEKDLTLPGEKDIDVFAGDKIDVSDIELPKFTGEGGDLGAAAVINVESKLQSTFGFAKLSGAPNISTALSPSRVVRYGSELLAENPLFLEKNKKGLPTAFAAETEIRSVRNELNYFVRSSIEEEFIKYRKKNGPLALRRIQTQDTFGAARKDGYLNFDEFKEELSKSFRRLDQHAIPEIRSVAEKIRKRVIDKLKNEATDVKLLNADVKVTTAPSYFTRLWDRTKIKADQKEFQRRVISWLRTKNENLDLETELHIAQDIINHITGVNGSRVSYLPIPGLRGPLKERVFDIPDDLIEDFLINDAEVVLESYIKTMSADIALAKRFDGDPTLSYHISKIKDDYNIEISKLSKTDPKYKKLRDKLEARMKKDIRNTEGMRDYLRDMRPTSFNNVYVDNFSTVAKSLNYTRLLGQVGLSALPDLLGSVLIHGLRTFKDGILPFAGSLNSFSKTIGKTKDKSTIQEFMREVRTLGLVVDGYLNSRGGSELSSLNSASSFSKFNRKMANGVSLWSGITHITDISNTISSAAAISRVIENATSKKLSRKEIEMMARFGLDKNMLSMIGSQFRKHGYKENGLYIPGVEKWDNQEVLTAFKFALSKMNSTASIKPGLDKPLFLSTPLGSLLGQFKSFGFAAYQRYFLAGIQQRDLATLGGSITLIGMGMLSHLLKETAAGRDVDIPPEKWIEVGIEKSGLLGYMFDVNNVVEKFTRNNVGLSALTGSGPVGRYRDRSILSTIFGPTGGLLEDINQTSGAISSYIFEGMAPSRKEISVARRLIPFQNVIMFRKLFDLAEENLRQNLGVED